MKPIQRSRYQSAYVERSERILRLLTAVNSCWTGFVSPVPVDLYSGNELNRQRKGCGFNTHTDKRNKMQKMLKSLN